MTTITGPAATTSSPITAAVTAATTPSSSTSGSTSSTASGSSSLAGNFDEFLQLLTTQLQNQNPLDPLDTNQFTSQLVQFSSVEQQINMNTQLSTLISLQQTAQSTSALGFVGQTVTVSGATATLANNQASWSYSSPSPANATFTIANSTGQTVYSTSQTVQAGTNTFNWNGLDSNGNSLPPGNYTMSISALSSSGASVAVATQVQGVVSSVDLTQNPPVLSVNGQNYTINQIQKISVPGS
jgi:flagellar basal-body rod modification protein FlgD